MTARRLSIRLVFFLLAACCALAHAQVGGRIALVSDYQARGVTLGDGRPSLQLSLHADGRDGWYAGTFASRIALDPAASPWQLSAYAGVARRWDMDAGWEAGILRAHYPGQSRYDYGDGFAGAWFGRMGVRLHYAPDYFGQGVSSRYAELNATLPVDERIGVLLHAGWQRAGGGHPAYPALAPARFDARLALALSFESWSVQLAAHHARQADADERAESAYGYAAVAGNAVRALPARRPARVTLTVAREF